MRIRPTLKLDSPGGGTFLAVLLLVLVAPAPLAAQRLAWQDESKPFRRRVTVSPLETGLPAVVTTEFFTHAQVTGEGPAVTVFARGDQVPSRVLQVGPGDFCRVAFQTRKSETDYQVYYGGSAVGPAPPAWTSTDGLLLETRQWRDCDLTQLASLQQAYQASTRLGSDYVNRVYHRHNPFDSLPAPFLSHYSGTLRVREPGVYRFFTSSQDCSFLLVDEKTVVASPGRHGPTGDARIKGELELSAGEHRFDYWHAAAGSDTCAVAAWQVPGAAQLEVIPAHVFGSDQTAHVAPQQLEHSRDGPLPDFRLAIRGEAPIEQDEPWAIRVEYEGVAPTSDRNGVCRWEFGDGQTSDEWRPTHVYLQPGEYTVTFRVRRRGRELEAVNRVTITRCIQTDEARNEDQLDDYLSLLDQYDLASLDARSLLQMVRLRLQREEWARALETGMHILTNANSADDGVTCQVATLLDPVTRYQLADSEAALRVWQAAQGMIQDPRRRARCALSAADVALNELLQTDEVRTLLAAADEQFQNTTGVDGADLQRVWGDWHARQGDAASALAAYRQAAQKRGLELTIAQQNARRGAYSRSTEAFLRDHDLPRAAEQLGQWQQDFPQDKGEGYLSTLLARYWMARGRPRVAGAVAGDLLAIAPHSPYADRLLMELVAAEEMLGRTDRAIAACETLLSDYPGSPLRDTAREKLAALKVPTGDAKGKPPPDQRSDAKED